MKQLALTFVLAALGMAVATVSTKPQPHSVFDNAKTLAIGCCDDPPPDCFPTPPGCSDEPSAARKIAVLTDPLAR